MKNYHFLAKSGQDLNFPELMMLKLALVDIAPLPFWVTRQEHPI